MMKMEVRNRLEEIVKAFFGEEVQCQVEPFGSGLINDTYRVEAADGRTVLLQRINHFVFTQPEVVMENIRRIAQYLEENQYPAVILQPIPTLDGRLTFLDEAGNYWRMFPFFTGTISIDQAVDAEQVYKAGQAYGEFARTLAGMDVETAGIEETIPGFHDSVSRLQFFEEVLAANPTGRLTDAAPEVGAVKAHQHLFFYIAALPLPLRITHNDTKINNVLFDRSGDRVRGVIDWDTIMPGVILSDFGDMVRTMTPSHDENHRDTEQVKLIVPYFEALCRGFLPKLQEVLTPLERKNLVKGAQWIVLEQALRFLTDYLRGDVYYKISYPEQNLLRTRNQLALFEALKEQEETLEKIIIKYSGKKTENG